MLYIYILKYKYYMCYDGNFELDSIYNFYKPIVST